MKTTITTAVELSKVQLDDITKQLKKKYGSNLEVQAVVEPEIIGGINITIGSQQLNGTLKHKLDTIKQQLKQI